jgi:hypothetical protein
MIAATRSTVPAGSRTSILAGIMEESTLESSCHPGAKLPVCLARNITVAAQKRHMLFAGKGLSPPVSCSGG